MNENIFVFMNYLSFFSSIIDLIYLKVFKRETKGNSDRFSNLRYNVRLVQSNALIVLLSSKV